MTRTQDGSALSTRVRTRLHRHKLDAELAAGADPNVEPLRRGRARELINGKTRHKIAQSIERMLAEADAAPRLPTSRVPIARSAIRDSHPDLEALVERLKAPTYISPQGVAMALALLTSGTGPLYRDGSEHSRGLKRTLSAVLDAIDHGPSLAY